MERAALEVVKRAGELLEPFEHGGVSLMDIFSVLRAFFGHVDERTFHIKTYYIGAVWTGKVADCFADAGEYLF